MEKYDRMKLADNGPLTGGRLLVLGLWIRSAIAGAAFAAAGVATLFDPGQGASLSTALTWIVAGSTFAWFARRRAVALLDGVDNLQPARPERIDASRLPSAARAPASS
jgi:hypothetical protein